MNKLHIHERICISCSERVSNVYADVHNTCLTYTSVHAWCSQHRLKCAPHSPQQMHMRSCMRAYATVQKLLCHGSYCELILSLARASCRLSFAARSCCPSCCLDQTRRLTLFAQEIRSNPRWDHDVVAAAMSHKHHSIIRVWSRIRAWPRSLHITEICFRHILREVSNMYEDIHTHTKRGNKRKTRKKQN